MAAWQVRESPASMSARRVVTTVTRRVRSFDMSGTFDTACIDSHSRNIE